MVNWKMIFLFQGRILRFQVNLPGSQNGKKSVLEISGPTSHKSIPFCFIYQDLPMDIILMSRTWCSFTSPWSVWIQESPRYKKNGLLGGGWTNPFGKICSSNWIISPRIGVQIKKNIWFTDHLFAFQHQVVKSLRFIRLIRNDVFGTKPSGWNESLESPTKKAICCSRWFFWLSWWCDMWVSSLEGVYGYQILSRLEKKLLEQQKSPFRSEKPLNLTIRPPVETKKLQRGNLTYNIWRPNFSLPKDTSEMMPHYLGPDAKKTSKRSEQKNMIRSFIQGEFIICVVFTSLTFFEIVFLS